MIVLESAGADPLGAYTFKTELYTGDNITDKSTSRWAIDGTVLTLRGKRYFIWSGWEDGRDEQWLYAAPMSNPWTISGNRVRLCDNNDHQWERVGETIGGRGLNEGPQILEHNGRVFIIYSASGSWQASYKMGLLELIGDDPLAPGAWRKHPKPVFTPTGKTFGMAGTGASSHNLSHGRATGSPISARPSRPANPFRCPPPEREERETPPSRPRPTTSPRSPKISPRRLTPPAPGFIGCGSAATSPAKASPPTSNP